MDVDDAVFMLIIFIFLFHRLCSLTLKKLVVLKELDKELNSLSIAVKIQVGSFLMCAAHCIFFLIYIHRPAVYTP